MHRRRRRVPAHVTALASRHETWWLVAALVLALAVWLGLADTLSGV